MPEPETPRTVKFANPGQQGATFPRLQSKTYTQKGLLTKSLNALEASVEDFGQASEEGTALTMKRKGGVFLDKVASVDLRKNQLEEAFDKLIEHTYELAESDFSPPTQPQVLGERDVRLAQQG